MFEYQVEARGQRLARNGFQFLPLSSSSVNQPNQHVSALPLSDHQIGAVQVVEVELNAQRVLARRRGAPGNGSQEKVALQYLGVLVLANEGQQRLPALVKGAREDAQSGEGELPKGERGVGVGEQTELHQLGNGQLAEPGLL